MGRRGPKPDYAKHAAFAKLIAEGVPSARASRMVGINPRTGKRWRNGRRIISAGHVLDLAPVIATRPVRRYSPRYLSEDERVRLADLRQDGMSVRAIATLMGRAASTISRELRRGADRTDRYRPHEAHRRALERRHLKRPSRLSQDEALRDWVAGRFLARWSPEQISHELRTEFPDNPSRWICAETIYQAVYRPDLGGLPRELPGRVLRRRRRQRVPRRHASQRRTRTFEEMTMIGQRPAIVLERTEPGHWEGDLIVGAGNKSAIVTLVERTTRFTLLGHLPTAFHGAEPVHAAVVAGLAPLPAHLRRTLTWDQGIEMALHMKITAELAMPVYFCDPHSPWQRPSNENTNGLLRDYFPKGTDLSVHTAGDLAAVAAELNARPRKTLGRATPAASLATLIPT